MLQNLKNIVQKSINNESCAHPTSPVRLTAVSPATTTKYETRSNSTNPFFIFQHEFRKKLKENGVKVTNTSQFAKISGDKWRQMSSNEKSSYFLWAHKNRQQKLHINRSTSHRSGAAVSKATTSQGRHLRHGTCPTECEIPNYIN